MAAPRRHVPYQRLLVGAIYRMLDQLAEGSAGQAEIKTIRADLEHALWCWRNLLRQHEPDAGQEVCQCCPAWHRRPAQWSCAAWRDGIAELAGLTALVGSLIQAEPNIQPTRLGLRHRWAESRHCAVIETWLGGPGLELGLPVSSPVGGATPRAADRDSTRSIPIGNKRWR